MLLQSIHQQMAQGVSSGGSDDSTARRMWWAALETLQETLLQNEKVPAGVWLAAPLPALYSPQLLKSLQGWVWAPQALGALTSPTTSLLPPDLLRAGQSHGEGTHSLHASTFRRLPLHEEDSHDPLLVVITAKVQIALALHGGAGQRQLLMRSEPETLGSVLGLIEQRLRLDAPDQALALHQALEALGPLESSSALGQTFWPSLATRLASMAPTVTLQASTSAPLQSNQQPQTTSEQGSAANKADEELSLLEAIAHEVRTPLSTIRTLIRSLLRRNDLPETAIKRLQMIDTECSEQIDRFGLIFQAAELQRQPESPSVLAQTDLGSMIGLLTPSWEQQLQRRGIELSLAIASNLSPVLSDPSRLEPMLGGLVDRCSRGLPSGSQLVLTLQPAGARLKLQLHGQSPAERGEVADSPEPIAELGPVLSWNPDTGSLQLSQTATRRLLARLGGRLTQRRDRGLTVFFPLAPHC